MSSRNEKDRAKQIQEKCQTILDQLLKDEDNKYCVDCDAKGPRWASWNLGIFLCIRCAGIHRNLGVHISKVKSVNLDSWTPEQVVSLQQMGNSRARAVYEANLPDAFRRPQTDSALEAFIRAKYEHRKYVAREWVPPSPPQVNWDKEIDEEMDRQKRKKKPSSSAATLGSTALPSPAEKKTQKSSEVPQPLPKPKSSASPKPGRTTPKRDTSATADLLGTTASPANDTKSQQMQQVEDVFSSFLSAPQSSSDTNKNVEQNKPVDLKTEEESFFNQPAPSEKEKSKMTKDSILALYSQGPAQNLGSQSAFAPTNNAPFTATFPNQMMNQTQFPQTQNAFASNFGSFPVQNSSFPMQNGATQQSNLAALSGQGMGSFGNFSQFPNAAQTQQGSFNQFSMQQQQPNQFPHQNTFAQSQNTFSSMPSQFSQQIPGQFPSMNGFQQTVNPQNGSTGLNGQQQQFFSMQPAANNLQQQFGNLSLGHQGTNITNNSFSAPQSLTSVFPAKTQTSNMTAAAASSVWQ